MEYDRKEFRKKFPHLCTELNGEEEEDVAQVGLEKTGRDMLKENVPDVILYIRRANTEDEAIDIVNYLRRRGEISDEYSRTLLKQIQEEGVRSFGSLRKWGNYEEELRKEPIAFGGEEEGDGDEELD